MKFSVLMSVYKNDNPDFLRLSLESIYDKQTSKPDEIVVVFDGPLTEKLYDTLSDFRKGKEDIVFYYPQEINKGLGEALKIGTEKCTGDYIFRMDSDDISDEFRFEKQISYIKLHPEIDVLGSNITEFNDSICENDLRERICPINHEDIANMAKSRNPMNHVTVCIKKSSLLNCGGYESLQLLEDYYLWVKMIISGYKFANLNESLVFVRVGTDFANKRGTKVRIEGWKNIQIYMVEKKFISKFKARKNILNIYTFIYCPNFIRNFLYKRLLRKKAR